MEDRGVPAYAAELIGTFLLVLAVGAFISVATARGGYTLADLGLVHALAIGVLVVCLRGASVPHLNPAVTVTMWALRRLAGLEAMVYVLLQLAGGVAGALVCKALLLDEGRAVGYGAAVISQTTLQGRPLPGLVAEGIGAFLWMLAVMATAVNPRGRTEWAAPVIGAAVGLAAMVMAPLTGAAFNPARWFGPAIVSNRFADGWVFVAGPLAGALIAGLGYTRLVLAPRPGAGSPAGRGPGPA